MNWFYIDWRMLSGLALSVWLAGCQAQGPSALEGAPPSKDAASLRIDLPEAWGGGVHCSAGRCLLAAVEHENGRLVVHALQGRFSRLLDQQPLEYHPDSAAWLSEQIVGVAVEGSASIEFFRFHEERLARVHQANVAFAPRDVVLVQAKAGSYRVLATPYSGSEVAWVDWYEDNRAAARIQRTTWCQTPWHPVKVTKLPQAAGAGIAVACLDDKQVVAVSDADMLAAPKVLARFTAIPRQARPSPSGQWLYVALETGGRNARIHMDTGELQWINVPPTGFVSVAPLADDLVVWGDSRQLILQRLDAQAQVLETRALPTSGFSTSLQVADVDGDGQADIVVLNSAGKQADVLYGPLWELAQPVN